MTFTSTFVKISAAVLIAGSAFTLASAADRGRDIGESLPQSGFINSDGSAVQYAPKGFGYSVNAPVSRLSDQTIVNQPTSSADR
ncbi:MAG: hypothetical protein RIR97_1974 [Pseudomonadota bacterium]|jgi:hypothetical protein